MVRRDFILKNEIRFPSVKTEDMIFTMCEICCAKNYLVIPNTFYFYRLRENSSVTEDKNLVLITVDGREENSIGDSPLSNNFHRYCLQISSKTFPIYPDICGSIRL